QRGRRRGAGIPVGARANVALAVGQGGFDIVHAFEPILPGVATSALRHSPGLTVATFHAPERALHYPVRSGPLERYRARIDALLATSPAAADQAAAIYPGDYTIIPEGIGPAFAPGEKDGTTIVCEWHGEGRAVLRALVKLVAATPGAAPPSWPAPTCSSPVKAATCRWSGRRGRAAVPSWRRWPKGRSTSTRPASGLRSTSRRSPPPRPPACWTTTACVRARPRR